MKISSLIFLLLLSSFSVLSQDNSGKATDVSRITLAPYVPPQVESIPEIATNLLKNKLDQIITQQGMGGSVSNQRFILTAKINVINKDITATAPPMIALMLDVTFYVGDGVDGTQYASTTVSCKGVGSNESKAYSNAFNMINLKNPEFSSFVDKGKSKIVEYYNSKCNFILKKSESLVNQDKYEEAIYNLVQVPEICKECYDKCMDAVAPIYQKYIDRQCTDLLSRARVIWSGGQDLAAANSATEILSKIDPRSTCFKEINSLVDLIAKRVKELNQRDWNFILKTQKDEVDIRKQTIKAARDIGVAYGNSQPKSVTYNVNGWW